MKWNLAFKYALGIIAPFLFFYVLWALVIWEYHPGYWSFGERFLWAVVSFICAAAICGGIYDVNSKKKR